MLFRSNLRKMLYELQKILIPGSLGFSKESSYCLTLLMGLNPEEIDSIIQALEATQVFSSHPAF
jgi:hypothetical protein